MQVASVEADGPRREKVELVAEAVAESSSSSTSECVVPLFSQVSGGPDTLIELCARPTVPACRTVPKSQRSSGSLLALRRMEWSQPPRLS